MRPSMRLHPWLLHVLLGVAGWELLLLLYLRLRTGTRLGDGSAALAVVGCLAAIGAFLGLSASRRLNRLRDAAEKLRRGEPHVRVGDASRDSIGKAALAFDEMAAELTQAAARERARRARLRRANARLVRKMRERAEESRRQMRELRLEHERDSLRRAVRAMEQVFGVLGHELRTPLAALRLSTEYLASVKVWDEREVRELLVAINGETIRMSEMVNNMLEVSRLGSGCATWNWGRFDLGAVVRESLEGIQPLIPTEGVRVQSELEEGRLQLWGDRDAARRLVTNLVTNALRHTKRGSILIDASECVEDGERAVRLSVRDTGSGIPERVREKLGQPFALNSGVIGSDYVSGAGLGLAICRGIAAAHGGRMEFHSREGEGSTVVAVLKADLARPVNPSSTPSERLAA